MYFSIFRDYSAPSSQKRASIMTSIGRQNDVLRSGIVTLHLIISYAHADGGAFIDDIHAHQPGVLAFCLAVIWEANLR